MRKMTNKIVIIDNDSNMLKALGSTFKQHTGYEIILLSDVRGASNIIETLKPSLVIIDFHLPDLSGFDVGYQIKVNKETSEIPIMFMAKHPTLENARLAFFLGAVDLIEKPFKPHELVEKAKASVEICELRRAIYSYLDRTDP